MSMLVLLAAIAGAGLAPDRPVEIRQMTSAFFPPTASAIGYEEGEAHVVVAVDETGRLTDAIAIDSNYPAFAEVAVDTVKRWKYGPAQHAGRAVPGVRVISFRFETEGTVVVNQNMQEEAEAAFLDFYHSQYKSRARTLSEVDSPPHPVSLPMPAYPPELRQAGVGGLVRVTYFIDQQGRVRVPAIDDDPPGAMAAAVLRAVGRWRFTPARFRGRPVLLVVSQTIQFGHPAQG